MNVDWIEPPEVFVPADLKGVVGGHPLVAETLMRRGFSDVEAARAFLDPGVYTPASPLELPDMDAAVQRIESAIENGEKICVWGDFDVDGQTATTLLVSALRALGARLTYHIPVRKTESHGVNLPVLSQILDGDPAVRLLLTCDTGIAAHEAVAYAQGRSVDVVITDHHELPERLPPARAVVNSNRLMEGHPLHTLPGVGVAYKLVEALYQRAGMADETSAYLDLAALGIVADVAEQIGEARYLLQRGLEHLRNPQRTGLKVMMDVAELAPEWLTEEHIGFVLGPRLNALGRLDDANQVVELLTTADEARARTIVYHLEGLNSRRQLLTSQVYHGALTQLERDPGLLDHGVLVLAHPDWPAGVIGIVASRLVEKFHKPAILIAAKEEELGRASARSVEGVDITAAIGAQADLLEGYGGHAMAAGFAIQPERIPDFRRRIGHTIDALERPPAKGLAIDAYLALDELSLDFIADLERLAPFGAGNPPLVLASRDLKLISQRKVGRGDEHLLLTVEDKHGTQQRVIWWRGADELEAGSLPEGRFDLAYSARASTFRGQRDVQIQWLEYRASERESLRLTPQREVEQIDYRDKPHPIVLLAEIGGPFQIWAEGEAVRKLSTAGYQPRGRYDLAPGEDLVVWTAPPDRSTWERVIERVHPGRVMFFGVSPMTDRMESFLERLGGLVKYALANKGGRIETSALAVAMAQRQVVVIVGLEWMAARGHIRILDDTEESFTIGKPEGEASERDAQRKIEELRGLLNETRAYRAYFKRADTQVLLNKGR